MLPIAFCLLPIGVRSCGGMDRAKLDHLPGSELPPASNSSIQLVGRLGFLSLGNNDEKAQDYETWSRDVCVFTRVIS